MRTIDVAALQRSVSVLGFGCAPLGSRVSPKDGRRALDLAFERGVTWFDVAPSYGDGEAETLLGRFACGRRDELTICTKVGVAPPRMSLGHRLARPIMRSALRAAPNLRPPPDVRSPAGWAWPAPSRHPIAPEAIEASLAGSLRRLRVDRVDVLLLHEPTPAEAADPRIWETLRRLIGEGQARTCGVAGSAEAVIAAARPGAPFTVAQVTDNPFQSEWSRIARSCPDWLIVTHSIFEGRRALMRLESRLAADPASRSRRQTEPPGEFGALTASALLLDYALARNAKGVVLATMFRPGHVEANCARASAPVRSGALTAIDALAGVA
ncbi:MAG TPA: aldo/keto reductase [Caulobacteraceae bacterium]|nr:aldo/keto reductase [Caulobacteraceae bacterium]